MDYFTKYDDYLKFLDQDKYKNYFDALNLYYLDDPRQICPVCNKIGIVKSKDAEGNLTMKCVHDCGWNMVIKSPEYINVYHVRKNKIGELNELLYQLTDTTEFNKIKNQYLNTKHDLDEIDEIFEQQQNEKKKLIDEKFETFSQLVELFYQRKKLFNEIKNPIPNVTKLKLIDIFKNEKGTLSDTRIKSIAKDYDLNYDDLINWFAWLKTSKAYIDVKTELDKVSKELENDKKQLEDINLNLLIIDPVIIEKKDVKRKVKEAEIPKKISPKKLPIKKIVVKKSPVKKPLVKKVVKKPIPTSGQKKIKVKKLR